MSIVIILIILVFIYVKFIAKGNIGKEAMLNQYIHKLNEIKKDPNIPDIYQSGIYTGIDKKHIIKASKDLECLINYHKIDYDSLHWSIVEKHKDLVELHKEVCNYLYS